MKLQSQQSALASYRNSPAEIARTRNLMDIVPKSLKSILDVGAREGHFSRLFAEHFESVTALDLAKPQFQLDRVLTVQGDVTNLPFPANSFDIVFCAEVLEHIPTLEKACSEMARVARHSVVVGVPYKQDIRLGRTTCNHCGKANPPWGHVNIFDEYTLPRLFPQCHTIGTFYVGTTSDRTNPFSTWLMDRAGNPWGVYDQEESCIHCGEQMEPPSSRSFGQKVLGAIALMLKQLQSPFNIPHPNWIHIVFRKG